VKKSEFALLLHDFCNQEFKKDLNPKIMSEMAMIGKKLSPKGKYNA